MLSTPCRLSVASSSAPRRRVTKMASGPTPPSGGKPKGKPARGPGSAPLRMQTDEQRKLGFGGDNIDGRGGGGGDDGRWEPGSNDDGGANPMGLAVLVACGIWAYWEWRRPGGKLNPESKKKASYSRYLQEQRNAERVRV